MTEQFDPYYRWLGISTKERPPNHYRLLGLELFESDLEVIDSIASRHIEYLQEINDGPHIKQAQQLLNELAAARRCLLDPASKEAYDEKLRSKLKPKRKPPRGASPPKPPPPAGTVVVPPPAVEPQPQGHPQASTPHRATHRPKPHSAGATRPTAARTRGQKPAPPARPLVILAVCGAVCAVALVAASVWLTAGGDREDETVAASAGGDAERAASATSGSGESGQQHTGAPQPGSDSQTLVDPAMSGELPDGITGAPEQHVDGVADPNETKPAESWTVSISIDGLQLWLDASNASTLDVASDYRVRRWSDPIHDDLMAEADRAEFRPGLVANVLGDRPVVRFSGSEWLEIPGTSGFFNSRNNYTIFFVARGARGTLLSKGTGETETSFAMSSGVTSFRSNDEDLGAGTSDAGEFRVRSIVAGADSLQWYIDGVASARHDVPHEIGATNILRVGCTYRNRIGAEAHFQGDLAELLVYDRALNAEERTAVEEYLSVKWLDGAVAPFPFDLPEPALAEAGDEMPEPDEPEREQSDGVGDESGSDAPGELASAKSTEHERRFVPLEPVAISASAGSELRLRGDGAILSDGAGGENETFQVTLETAIPRITAILLEALPDDSLPGKGPGHGLGGVFSLTDFSATSGPRDESRPAQEVSFFRAISDDASGAERLIDDDAKTIWTVRRRGEVTRVVFFPRELLGDEAGARVELTLANRDALGCFRISVTSALEPGKVPFGDEAHEDGDGVLRVNLGGKAWRDPEGNQWVESKEFDGTTFGHEGGQSIETDGVRNAVFATAQRGLTGFRAVVPDGVYEVQLYFSEHWTNDPARRIFSVVIERQPILEPVNVFRAPGFGSPYVYGITNVTVADGRLDIDFAKAGEDTSTILNGVTIRPTQ